MKLAILFFFICSTCLAQSGAYKRRQAEAQRQKQAWEKEQQEAVKRWRQQMVADRALIQKYFKSDLFKKFDKQIDKVFKSIDPGAFQQFFDDDNFDKMLGQISPSQGLAEGDFRWIETPKERILVLKMTMEENKPFDIKIENNHIIVKGSIVQKKEQKTSQGTSFYQTSQSIRKSFSIPNDVDGNKAEFESKAGEVLIKLPKKKISDLYKRDKRMNLKIKKPTANPSTRPGLKPISPSSSDLTI